MLVKNSSFTDVLQGFRNKRVFITGHTGFKGSWLSLLLHTAGAEVKGYALAPDHDRSLFEMLSNKMKFESIIADIRDRTKIMSEMKQFKPDYIFHLAAQPLVRYSYAHPIETFDVNVMGTAYVLEAIRTMEHPCTAIIVTTDKVYENYESGNPFVETDPLGGYDPYSSSKAAAELVTQSYMRSYRSPEVKHGIATARAGNVIGGGDRASDRVMPDLIRSLTNNQTLELRNPTAVRPWQHVLDPLAGYLALARLLNSDTDKYQGSYNFGPLPGDELHVEDIVKMAIAFWGGGNYKITTNKNQLHEAQNLKLDIAKAMNTLSWKPKWNTEKAVSYTVSWFKAVDENGIDPFKQCLENIDEFLK